MVLTALSLISNLSEKLDVSTIDSVVDILFPCVLKITMQSKRILVNEASSTIMELISKTGHFVRFLPQILAGLHDKNANLRLTCCNLLNIILQQFAAKKGKREHFEKSSNFDVIEKCLLAGLGDSNNQVRTVSRDVFYCYKGLWPLRAARYSIHI